jgi:putative aminopeptidase FrvX
VVSVPCRYIHAPVGILLVEDLENAARLVGEMCRMPWPDGPLRPVTPG